MKLYFGANSPFARKVAIVVAECGLEDRVERVPVDIRNPNNDFHTIYPLAKVPMLVRDDGSLLGDSPVICEYLDSLHDGHKLVPAEGDARWNALNLQSFADGILEGAILYNNERVRPDGQRSDAAVQKQMLKAQRGYNHIENNMDLLDGPLNIGQIALAAGFGWVDLRIERAFWAEGRPKLEAWVAAFDERPSMKATVPPGD